MRRPHKRNRETLSGDATDRTPQVNVRVPKELTVRPCLLFLSGVHAGKVIPVDVEAGPVRIGRKEGCEVFTESPEVSRVHAIITRDPDGKLRIEDNDSSNGTYLNQKPIRRALLCEGDKLRVGQHLVLKVLFHDEEELVYANQFYERANQDSLTGLANRHYFLQHLEREIASARRHARPLSLAILDIDRFKEVNDTHGHPTGDAVLCELAARGKAVIREEDLLARYGGEEFFVVLRDTGPREAIIIAERLRECIADTPFTFAAKDLAITVSVGVVAIGGEAWSGITLEQMIEVADARLYRAKGAGRNRVEAKLPPIEAE